MISRTWHGIVPIANKKAFEDYEYQTGVKDTIALPGNLFVHKMGYDGKHGSLRR